MSKATQCAEALQESFDIGVSSMFCDQAEWDPSSTEEIADVILRFYPEEQGCTYQKDEATNSLRMIDDGRDV